MEFSANLGFLWANLALPDRGTPVWGEVDYPSVFAEIAQAGWRCPLGAEYRAHGPVEAGLGWLAEAKRLK